MMLLNRILVHSCLLLDISSTAFALNEIAMLTYVCVYYIYIYNIYTHTFVYIYLLIMPTQFLTSELH